MSQGPIFPPVRGSRDDEPGDDVNPAEEPAAGQDRTPALTRAEMRAQAEALAVNKDEAAHSLDAFADEQANSSLSADDEEPDETNADNDQKRFPWWVWLLIGVGVVAVVVAVVIAVTSRGSSDAAPTVTVTAAAPAPTGTPMEKGEGSVLYQAIPEVTNQFVLASLTPNEAWVKDRNAAQAYDAHYEGPASTGNGTVQLQVTIGQWASADDATLGATALTSEIIGVNTNLSDVLAVVESSSEDEPAQSDPAAGDESDSANAAGAETDAGAKTDVEGSTAQPNRERVGGLWSPIDGLAKDDSPGALVWTNDTVVITLQGPSNELQRFYDGYGL